jgi:hypothetical protein
VVARFRRICARISLPKAIGRAPCKFAETVWSALQKSKTAQVGNEEMLDELGITEIEKDLVSIDPKYRQFRRRRASIRF